MKNFNIALIKDLLNNFINKSLITKKKKTSAESILAFNEDGELITSNDFITSSGGTITGDLTVGGSFNQQTLCAIPYLDYNQMPSKSIDTETFFKEWISYVQTNYANLIDGYSVGEKTIVSCCRPNGSGWLIGHTFNSAYLTQYSGFTYQLYGGHSLVFFGYNDGIWFYKTFNQDSYLPLSGGTLTGELTAADRIKVINAPDQSAGDKSLNIEIGSSTQTGYVGLDIVTAYNALTLSSNGYSGYPSLVMAYGTSPSTGKWGNVLAVYNENNADQRIYIGNYSDSAEFPTHEITLRVKDKYAKINDDKIMTYNGDVSTYTLTTNAGDKIYMYKYGRVVFISSYGEITSLSTGAGQVAVLPSGWRPIQLMDCAIANDNPATYRVRLYQNGAVEYANWSGSDITSAHNFSWSATYICS